VLLFSLLVVVARSDSCPSAFQSAGSQSFSFVDPNLPAQSLHFSYCNPYPSLCQGSQRCGVVGCCNVCQTWGSGGACLGYLTSYEENGGVYILHYDLGGDPVTEPPGPRQAVIQLSCGPSPFTLTTYLDGSRNRIGNVFMYSIEGKSSYACPGNAGGVTGGGWFFIFLTLFVSVYILGCVIYSKVILKEPGIFVFPQSHVEFWSAAPGLAKDGIMFTLAKFSGGKYGYVPLKA